MKGPFRFLWSSLAGGTIMLAAMVLHVLNFPKSLSEHIVPATIATFVIGALGGALIEFFIARINEAATALTYSVQTQSGVADVTAAFCSLWLNHQKLIALDMAHPVRRWAVIALLEHITVISAPAPTKARETYCHYLYEALRVAGAGSSWLGIHQTEVDFFSKRQYEREVGQYDDALRAHTGPKYRIFVETPVNEADFQNRKVMRDYLRSKGAARVSSFLISQAAFNRLVEPRAGSASGDWALYGEEIVLEFDKDRKAIVFHLNDAATDGMKRLLHAVRSPQPTLGIGLERIDEAYVARLKQTAHK